MLSMKNNVDIKVVDNHIVIVKGGFKSDNPSEYMDNVVKDILKSLGNPKYNEFIENYLDNPWIRILIFDFNGIEFDNNFEDIINNIKI